MFILKTVLRKEEETIDGKIRETSLKGEEKYFETLKAALEYAGKCDDKWRVSYSGTTLKNTKGFYETAEDSVHKWEDCLIEFIFGIDDVSDVAERIIDFSLDNLKKNKEQLKNKLKI